MTEKRISLGLISLALASVANLAAAQATNTFPSSGNVGIGTTSPSQVLDVKGNSSETYVQKDWLNETGVWMNFSTDGPSGIGSGGAGVNAWIAYASSNGNWFSNAQPGDIVMRNTNGKLLYGNSPGNATMAITGGNVGIGTTSPAYSLDVAGMIHTSTAVIFPDGTQQTTAWTGTVCGGDYAESVDVTGLRKSYGPGDVLVIDPKLPGNFLKSADAYSTSVAGIYSTKPGLVGRRQGDPKSPDAVPMAMVGIVPTKVIAENGPIRPGDLLVTSSTLGYAMKGTDRSKMLGAVIGKALGNLDSGKGMIEVVVMLQ